MAAARGARAGLVLAALVAVGCGPMARRPAPDRPTASARQGASDADGPHLIDVDAELAGGRPHLIAVPPGLEDDRPIGRMPAPATGRPAPIDPAARRVYLRLRLGERRVYLMPADRPHGIDGALASFPVAIGRKGYDTPTGRFQVIEKIVDPDFVLADDWDHPTRLVKHFPPGPDNPLGRRWIGFTRAHGWGIGFHGTPHPELIGRAVSHGCVRMHDADVVRLFDRVGIGTTVVVEP